MRSFRCLNCGVKVVPINYRDERVKFCGKSCAATFNNKKFPKRNRSNEDPCPNCGERTGVSADKYCSIRCSAEYRKKVHIERWLADPSTGTVLGGGLKKKIREYLIEQAGYKCSECGWNKKNPITGKCPLHIDHVDGDAHNNHPDNLRVLCPNCHALTPTYGYIGARKSSRVKVTKEHNAETEKGGKKHRTRKDGVGSRTNAGSTSNGKTRGSHSANSGKR